MLGGKIAHLGSLVADDVARVGDVLINELLVLDINEGSQEDDAVGNQSETPQGDPLDKPVADEGRKEGLDIVSMSSSSALEREYLHRLWPRCSRRTRCVGTR